MWGGSESGFSTFRKISMWPRLSSQDLNLFEPFNVYATASGKDIRVIYFDIGSVLIDLDWDSFFGRLHELNPENTSLSSESVMRHLRENHLMQKWCSGAIGPLGYAQGILEAAGHSKEKAHRLALGIETLSNGIFAPTLIKEHSSLIVGPARPRVVRLIQNLRKHNYIVGALSNATPWHESDILRTTSLHELFDVVIFSQDVGSEKPEENIYRAAHNAARDICRKKYGSNSQPLTESQLAFVDDTPANVRAARALGWHASLVCLLKSEYIESWHSLGDQKLSDLSTNSCNLVFGEEAARRVESLFSKLT
jgi:FMN phosphatase YigB (HAD superfamily)